MISNVLATEGTLLLVGNSKSLLGKELGSFIDSHETVVRFNNFQIKSYEKDVGTKTNWVCMRSCDDVNLHRRDFNHKKDCEKIFSFITYCKYTSGMRMVASIRKAIFQFQDFEVVDEEKCFNYAADMNFKNDLTEWPSVGSLSICHFTKLGYKLKLVGFDWGESHYYTRPPKDGCFHNWQKERDYISKLENVEIL